MPDGGAGGWDALPELEHRVSVHRSDPNAVGERCRWQLAALQAPAVPDLGPVAGFSLAGRTPLRIGAC